MSTSKNIRYVPAIDHLRAYAALLVLLFHVFDRGASTWPRAGNPFMSLLYEGHTGVALFLVLSGFIFTYGSAGREIEYKTFLLNRVLRIYPLLIALTFVAVSAGAPLSTTQVIESLLPVKILYLPAASGPAVFIQVFWTITVEFQFYLIFPFLYRQLLRRGVFGLVPLLVFLLLARWSAFLLGCNPQALSYFTILGRLDQFLIGMFAATAARRLTLDSRLLRWALPVGVVGLVTALWFFNQGGGFPAVVGWKIVWPTLEATLWALIILGYLALLQGKNHPILRAIAGVGTVSYSMYLLHNTVIAIAEQYGLVFELPRSPFLSGCLTGLFCVFPLTLLVSILTYHTIEKPFLGLRRRYIEPGSIPSPSPGALPVMAEHRTETAEPLDLRWPLAWLLATGVVAVVVIIFLHQPHALEDPATRLGVEHAIATADESYPTTCKVLSISEENLALAMEIGQHLIRAHESFVVPEPRWKDTFGPGHDWGSLNAQTLGNGLLPWYIALHGVARPGTPADTPTFPVRDNATLILTPSILNPTKSGNMAEMSFGAHGNAANFLLGGWAALDEPYGTWTQASWAALSFQPQTVRGTNVEIAVDCSPFVAPEHGVTRQRLHLFFNGVSLNQEQQVSKPGTVQFTVPVATWNAAAAKKDAYISLAFELPDAVSPAALAPASGNGDTRKLGVYITGMRLRPVP